MKTEYVLGGLALAFGGLWWLARDAGAAVKKGRSSGGAAASESPDCGAEVDWALALMAQADASNDPDFVGGAGDTLLARADAVSDMGCEVEDGGAVKPLETWLRDWAEVYRERGLDVLRADPERYGYTYDWVDGQVRYALNSQNPTVMRNVAAAIRGKKYVNAATRNAALSAAAGLEDAADALSQRPAGG